MNATSARFTSAFNSVPSPQPAPVSQSRHASRPRGALSRAAQAGERGGPSRGTNPAPGRCSLSSGSSLSTFESAGACNLGDFRASSLTTLVQMVSGGVGVTLLPEMSARVEAGAERQPRIVPFAAKGPYRTIGLAWRRSSLRGPEFRLLGEAIQRGRRPAPR